MHADPGPAAKPVAYPHPDQQPTLALALTRALLLPLLLLRLSSTPAPFFPYTPVLPLPFAWRLLPIPSLLSRYDCSYLLNHVQKWLRLNNAKARRARAERHSAHLQGAAAPPALKEHKSGLYSD